MRQFLKINPILVLFLWRTLTRYLGDRFERAGVNYLTLTGDAFWMGDAVTNTCPIVSES